MTREIDLQAILQTTQRRPRARAGEVLVREGDAPVALFVVLAGRVELRKTTPRGDAVSLGVVTPGDMFGIEALANLPMGSTAVVVDDATLLVVDPRTALELLVRRPRFTLGLLQILCDRVATLERQAASGTVVAAPELPPTGAVGQRMLPPRSAFTPRSTPTRPAASPTTQRTPAAASAANAHPGETKEAAPAAAAPAVELPKEFWTKHVVCPVCAADFEAVHLRSEAVRLKERDSDFCERYHGYSPLHYAVYVCPECFYAAYPDDFGTLSSKEAVAMGSALAELLESTSAQIDFRGMRDHAAATASFRFAVHCYHRRDAEARKLAGLHHRLAWLAREGSDAKAEQEHLAQARDAYRAALDQRPPLEGRAEATAMYLLADINARLGDAAEALRWLEAAAKHPEADKTISRAAQELRQTIRERARS